MGGASDLLAQSYSFIAYVKLQTRLTTATADLTGNAPLILETWNTNDCGAGENGTFACSGNGVGGAGCWGAQVMPNQVLITVYLSGVATGVPNVGGWSSGQGAAATPSYVG
jgi:hypothetical protein